MSASLPVVRYADAGSTVLGRYPTTAVQPVPAGSRSPFTQGFARGLGVTEQVVSPTFTLARQYDGTALRLNHLDVYRLDHLQEIVDLGIHELADEDAVAVIEWGDMAEPVLPKDFLEVRLTYGEVDDVRHLELRAVGASWAARATALQRALERWTS